MNFQKDELGHKTDADVTSSLNCSDEVIAAIEAAAGWHYPYKEGRWLRANSRGRRIWENPTDAEVRKIQKYLARHGERGERYFWGCEDVTPTVLIETE